MSTVESPDKPGPILRATRLLFWLYLFLLVFEGVFRKWIFPSQSNLFLIIRDPLVVVIYALAIIDRRFPFGIGFFVTATLGGLAMLFSMFTPTTEVIVTLYGFKASFLHLPLVFVIPAILDRGEIERIVRATLFVAPVVAALMLIQFRSPPESWWNVGVGGSEDGQMYGALGRVRPPGPFSFITGAAQFAGVLAAFVIYRAVNWGRGSRILFAVALVSVLIMGGVSVSRMLLTMAFAPLLTVVLLLPFRPELLSRMLAPLVLAVAILAAVGTTDAWDDGVEAMNARLGLTGDYHSSFADKAVSWVQRPLSDPIMAFRFASEVPLMGYGLGAGTNVAAATRTGRLSFLLGEGEWVRCINELGLILGFPYLFLRLVLAVGLFIPAYRAAREGDGLALLMAVNAAQLVAFGQWSQATSLGFAVVSAGLCLAAARWPVIETEESTSAAEDEARPLPRLRQRVAPTLAVSAPAGRVRFQRPVAPPPPAEPVPEPDPEPSAEPARPARFRVRVPRPDSRPPSP